MVENGVREAFLEKKGEKYYLITYIFPAPGSGNIRMLTGAFGQVINSNL